MGGAALAIATLNDEKTEPNHKALLMDKLLRPRARIDLNSLVRAYASAAIDISDGLSADLHHICAASGVGAALFADKIPFHPLLLNYPQALDLALSGGDDYELCFTVPENTLKPVG